MVERYAGDIMNEAMRPLSLTISGMSCGGCTRRVRAALQAIDGATDVEVKVGGATITVPVDVDNDELSAAITKLGFTVDAVTVRTL